MAGETQSQRAGKAPEEVIDRAYRTPKDLGRPCVGGNEAACSLPQKARRAEESRAAGGKSQLVGKRNSLYCKDKALWKLTPSFHHSKNITILCSPLLFCGGYLNLEYNSLVLFFSKNHALQNQQEHRVNDDKLLLKIQTLRYVFPYTGGCMKSTK